MLRRVTLVKTDVLEEFNASIIRVKTIGEIRKTLAGTIKLLVIGNVLSSPILVTLMMEAICFSETLVLRRAT
jgi:hypothetical protein